MSAALYITPQWRQQLRRAEEIGHVVHYWNPDQDDSVLRDLSGCKLDRALVVGDVADPSAPRRLLKLVEDAVPDIYCFASADVFDRVFLSRFSLVVKCPVPLEPRCDSYQSFLERVQLEGSKHDFWEHLVVGAPSYLPLAFSLCRSPLAAKRKLFA